MLGAVALGPFATASRRTPPVVHCHSPGVATVARRLRIDVHNNDDNAWQRGPLWPHGMGPTTHPTSLLSANHAVRESTCRRAVNKMSPLNETTTDLYRANRDHGLAPVAHPPTDHQHQQQQPQQQTYRGSHRPIQVSRRHRSLVMHVTANLPPVTDRQPTRNTATSEHHRSLHHILQPYQTIKRLRNCNIS